MKNTINSRNKGKRGERQWRDELRENGYPARRGQQFSGSPESPDVVCDGLPWAHFEVKLVERLNLGDAIAQARRDQTKSGLNSGKAIFVAHRKNFWPWLVTMEAVRFYRFLRRDLSGDWATQMAAGFTPVAACAEFAWLRCCELPTRTNIHDAVAQTKRDGDWRVAVVAHRDRDDRWLVTITAKDFFKFLRGDFADLDSLAPAHSARKGPPPSANSFRRFPSDSNLRGVLPPVK